MARVFLFFCLLLNIGTSSLLGQDFLERDWTIRVLGGVATTNTLGEIAGGEINDADGTSVYGLEIGRNIHRDLFGLPIDVSANFGLMHHFSDAGPSGIWQYNLYLKIEWTEFWWSDHLRTKIGVGEGLSYVDEITYSETVRRDGGDSKNLLNYLDFSISLNSADLASLLRLDHLFGFDSSRLEHTWLVANLSHRSGIYGIFGEADDEDGNRNPVEGGDNILMIGLTHEF